MIWELKTKQKQILEKKSLSWIPRPSSHGPPTHSVTWKWQESGEYKDTETWSLFKLYQGVRELLWGAEEDFGFV